MTGMDGLPQSMIANAEARFRYELKQLVHLMLRYTNR